MTPEIWLSIGIVLAIGILLTVKLQFLQLKESYGRLVIENCRLAASIFSLSEDLNLVKVGLHNTQARQNKKEADMLIELMKLSGAPPIVKCEGDK